MATCVYGNDSYHDTNFFSKWKNAIHVERRGKTPLLYYSCTLQEYINLAEDKNPRLKADSPLSNGTQDSLKGRPH